MKKIISSLVILIVGMFILNLSAIAQTPVQADPNKPDEQLTKEEAIARIQEWTNKIDDLKAAMTKLDADIVKLKKDLDDANANLKKCNEDYYKMWNVSQTDIDKFAQELGQIEGRLRDMKKLPDDVLADKNDEIDSLLIDLNKLRLNKIVILPQFFDKIPGLAREIKGLHREKVNKEKLYTVRPWAESKDCLWNIAGRTDNYGDPLAWPKIWQANTDKIKNPDIIRTGMVIKLPPAGPKTDSELKAERKYWRNKRAAMSEQNEKPAKKGE
jgi:nucleoid-associated protein YgaU